MLRRLAASTAAAVLVVTGWPLPAAADALPDVPPRAPRIADIAGYPQQNTLPAWPDNPAAGNGVVLIGTDPIWRLHAKGLQPQLARALFWASEL